MTGNGKELENFEIEFNELMQKFEGNNTIRYNYREKYLKTEWLNKLKQSKSSPDEIKLRNRFIKHFVDNQKAGINLFCIDPFNEIPKGFSGTLKDLKKLLPKDPHEALNLTEDEKHSYMTDLFDSLVDKGSFLAQQPVPRCGSFFIHILKSNDVLCKSKHTYISSPEMQKGYHHYNFTGETKNKIKSEAL